MFLAYLFKGTKPQNNSILCWPTVSVSKLMLVIKLSYGVSLATIRLRRLPKILPTQNQKKSSYLNIL